MDNCIRIVQKHKTSFRAVTADGDMLNCYLPGKLLHDLVASELPAVGDWCTIGERFVDQTNEPAAMIAEVLPRASKISRMSAGPETGVQVLAANVDYVFIVTSVNHDFSIGRLRRYVFLARSGNAQPVIVLSKTDLVDEEALDDVLESVSESFPDVPVACVSALSGDGLEQIRALLVDRMTGVFIGSSGVGKSTLVNRLLENQLQKTTEVRAGDDKGRHTTSSSGLFFIDSGGAIIDTPGLREVALIGDCDELPAMMPTVAELAVKCRFSNCTHGHEPGCAVQNALDSGALTQSEYASYAKLQRELLFARRKLDERLESTERKKWKRIAIEARRRKKAR